MKYHYSSESFEKDFTYTGTDLGASWYPDHTLFRLWAPTADDAAILLYESGNAERDDLIRKVPMYRDIQGTWAGCAEGNLNGVYYTCQVTVEGRTIEACDPYARTTGVNGNRAMILDLASTDPENWEQDRDPHFDTPINDSAIYELHVRDLSIERYSGIHHKGKYLGLIEAGTHTKAGVPTGLDHIKALGITHVHLLPVYDYGSVDESFFDHEKYNWGYDPVNFNVPEGSYSTDPFHGQVRVAEFKQMVKGLHDNGISVIMDVVYNHVYRTEGFCFNRIVPGYFSRQDENGKYSDASCCGNDTASERSMVRKYIVDSVNYWADEYHIDGFRFDLVGLIDTITINEIMNTVHKKHPNVIFYGEGWDMPSGVTKKDIPMTTQRNAALVPGFAFFNDTIRDAMRGSVFYEKDPGYACGRTGNRNVLTSCFFGAPGWALNPEQVVNYVSCHDNHTLFDRISTALPDASREERILRNNLASAFSMLSQGIPFLQAGEEMLRTKPGPRKTVLHNSYNSPDRVNSLKWSCAADEDIQETIRYYQGLIALRKAFRCFRMTDRAVIRKNILEKSVENEHVHAFLLTGDNERVIVAFNADTQPFSLNLPDGSWKVCIRGKIAGTRILDTVSENTVIPPLSTLMLVQNPADFGSLS